MAELLLDITVFEDYRSGDLGARDIFDRIMDGELKAAVSSLTVYHVWSGPSFDRRSEIGFTGMLSFLEEACLTVESAKTAAVWTAALNNEEKADLSHYAMVAAIAKERGESICTRNPDPFLKFYSQVIEY